MEVANYVGLKWFKCDLHLHTPQSKCFIDNCTPEEYIEKVKQEGLNVISITDHNSAGWIDKIKLSTKMVLLFFHVSRNYL